MLQGTLSTLMPGDVLRHDTLAIALLPLILEEAIQQLRVYNKGIKVSLFFTCAAVPRRARI